jgi:hypothetical protein
MTTLRHCTKGDHDLPDTDEFFCGKYRWCRACFSAYRKAWRKRQREKILALRASDAPMCVVCNSARVMRKGAFRCAKCISNKLYRCALPCGRVTSNPTCGKCRTKLNKLRKAAKREAQLAKRLNIVSDGNCARCGKRLRINALGQADMRHDCES